VRPARGQSSASSAGQQRHERVNVADVPEVAGTPAVTTALLDGESTGGGGELLAEWGVTDRDVANLASWSRRVLGGIVAELAERFREGPRSEPGRPHSVYTLTLADGWPAGEDDGRAEWQIIGDAATVRRQVEWRVGTPVISLDREHVEIERRRAQRGCLHARDPRRSGPETEPGR